MLYMSLTCHVIGTYQGDHHIVCSAVSTCASWAAFSDVYHISLFKLNLVSKIFVLVLVCFFTVGCMNCAWHVVFVSVCSSVT